jgi:hypothetical protein
MVELDKWLPLGTLLHLTFPAANDSALVTVVRSMLSDDFTRRYGVACVHSELPYADLYNLSGSLADEDDLSCPFGLQWPAARSDIRRVYRTLARRMHPDAGGTDARFRTLHQAYLDALAVAAR